MVKIVGNRTKLQRVPVGLYTFDRAFVGFGELGYPMNSAVELFGPTHCGKSTVTYSITGLLATALGTNITLADFEGFDIPYLEAIYNNVGFEGELKIVNDKTDEKSLDGLVVGLGTTHRIGIVDSVGAISPISEADGDIGDANMGRRAKLMAQFIRKATHALIQPKESATLFLINHVHPRLGGLGTLTPGGETMGYLSGIRIRLKQKTKFDDGSFHIQGTVVKNKYGQLGRTFNLMVLSGYGVHKGLTAFIDATELELIAVKNGVVRTLEGTKICRASEVLKAAKDGNEELFQSFYSLLEDNNKPINSIKEEDETIDDDSNQ